MRLYIAENVVAIFQIETEQFGMEKICLEPGWAEGVERVWGMTDAGRSKEPIVELKSAKMSIWVPQRCVAELDEQLIVRGRKGFTIGAMTDSLCSRAIPFVEEND